MATTTFKIGSGESQFDFTLETDASSNLVSISAMNGSNSYECLLELHPDNRDLEIQCCRPVLGCTGGACSA